jgi:sec-independent protein translocase protein TatA
MNFGFQELLLIFLVVMLLFGAKKLPELARGIGKVIREFRSAAKDVDDVKKEFERKIKI